MRIEFKFKLKTFKLYSMYIYFIFILFINPLSNFLFKYLFITTLENYKLKQVI